MDIEIERGEIRRGLAEAWALARAHSGTLAVYVGLGVVIPFLLLSSEPIFSLRTVMAILADPFTYRVGGSITGPLYLIGIVAVIVAGAMLAAWNAIGSDVREGYMSEIMYGMVAGFAYLLANLTLAVVFGLIAALPLFLVGPGVLLGGDGELRVGIDIYRIVFSLVGSWIAARFCLAGAIMGSGGKLEPVSAFIASWRRTRTAQWRLFGFFLLYGVPFGIAVGVLMVVHGAVIVNQAPGGLIETVLSFCWVVLFALYFLGQILIPAGLYRASEPAVAASEVFA